jgi:tRNA(Ile)-lysidine synthase
MPGLRRFGRGWLARPLLDLDRPDLEARARTLDFPWLTDPANESPEPDRNHLRHEVLPLLRRRWPAATRGIARAAANLADELAVLEWLGGADLAACRSPSAAVLPVLGCLSRAAVVATGERRRNLLRHWFRFLGVRSPSAARLGEIERQFLDREPAVTAVVRWDRVEMRAYRGRIYLVPEREPLTGIVDWCLDEPLELARPGIRLRALRTTAGTRIGAGLDRLQVARRRGGERCRPAGRGHSQTLGRLFQESGVAPWERDLVPLLWCVDGLVFVPGPGPCEPFAARGDEPGFAIRIEPLTGP